METHTWKTSLEDGIRDAITQTGDNTIIVSIHSESQRPWAIQKAQSYENDPGFPNTRKADTILFLVVTKKKERERYPVGSIVFF